MNIVGGENKEHRGVDKFVSDQMKRALDDLLPLLPVTYNHREIKITSVLNENETVAGSDHVLVCRMKQ